MATEDIFVASAITSTAIIALFLYLHSRTKDPIWSGLWMFGAFGGANWALVVINYAFENGGLPNLSPMTEVILGISDFLIMGIFIYLGGVLAWQLITALFDIVSGRKNYGKTDDRGPEFGG